MSISNLLILFVRILLERVSSGFVREISLHLA